MAYYVVDNKCVGCKMCVLACPFGAIEVYPDHGKVEKCDLCPSIDGNPECVKVCRAKALLFTDEDAGAKAMQSSVAIRMKEAYKEIAG